ncbi:MAG: hypothetical protein RIS92_1681 [Verrucomicrobiota bacterium]
MGISLFPYVWRDRPHCRGALAPGLHRYAVLCQRVGHRWEQRLAGISATPKQPEPPRVAHDQRPDFEQLLAKRPRLRQAHFRPRLQTAIATQLQRHRPPPPTHTRCASSAGKSRDPRGALAKTGLPDGRAPGRRWRQNRGSTSRGFCGVRREACRNGLRSAGADRGAGCRGR